MRKIKYLSILVLVILYGCSGSSDGGSAINGTDDSAYDNETYKLDEYSIASLESADSAYLLLPPKLNSWLISTVGDNVEIALKLHARESRSPFNDPSVWAFFIRTEDDPVGIKYFDELEARLFYNYSEMEGLCCSNTLPFGSWDQSESSYIPVSGYIDFTSSREGSFSLDFQQESETNSGILIGQIVNIKGCWKISGEGGVSGCSIQ